MQELATWLSEFIKNPTIIDCVMGVLAMVMVIGIVKCLTVGLFSK